MPPLSSNLIRYKKPIFLSTEEMAQTTPQTIAPIASPLQRASGAISGISEGVGRFMKPRLENLSKQFEPENIADTALAFSPLGFTKKVGTYGAEFAKQQIKRNAPKGFQGLKNLSTKLLEKFRGMPEEITPQQFNEVINRAKKEGIRKADLDMIKEAAERQKISLDMGSRKEISKENLENIRGSGYEHTINEDGTLTLYHKTTSLGASNIERTGF